MVDHKPPLIYHLYDAGFALLGQGHAHGAHLLVLLAVLATGALLWKLAAGPGRGQGDAWPLGAVTAGLFLVFSTTWHDYDALAANCELFLLLPQTAAALLLLRSLPRAPAQAAPPWSLPGFLIAQWATGALIGLSALCKYQGLTFLGVSAGLLAWAAAGGRLRWLQAGLALLIQTLAAAVPPAAYLAVCAGQGNARDAVDWFLFNFSYVGAGLSGLAALQRAVWRLSLIGGAAGVVYALGIWGAVRVLGQLRRVLGQRSGLGHPGAVPPDDREVLALLWLGTSAVAVAAGGRFFGHYFHLLLPPLSVLAAPWFLTLWQRGPALRATLVTLTAVPGAGLLPAGHLGSPAGPGLGPPRPSI